MKIDMLKLMIVIEIFVLSACKHRRSAVLDTSSISSQELNLEKFDFFDDEGYPVPRDKFSIKAVDPECIVYEDGPNLENTTEHSREYSFYTFDSETGTRTAYQSTFDNGSCSGTPIKASGQGSKISGKVNWEKHILNEKKVLFSPALDVVDYGSSVCLLVTSKVDSESVFCTALVYNRIISKKDSDEPVGY